MTSPEVGFRQLTIQPVVTPLFEKITLKSKTPHKLREALHLLQEACPDLTISPIYPDTNHAEAYITRKDNNDPSFPVFPSFPISQRSEE